MRIKILGSSAGGGFPQWNCHCANCAGVRNGTLDASPRTQSSIALSDDDGKSWILCNASPDILSQLAHNPELCASETLRGSSIGAIVLTDSQIDHTTGLLSLREGCPHHLFCTKEVHTDLNEGFPVFPVLSHWNGGLIYHEIIPYHTVETGVCDTVKITAIPLISNAPPYSKWRNIPLPGHNIALFIEDSVNQSALFYAPGVGEWTEDVQKWAEKADCLLVDGTVWHDKELANVGVGTHTGKEMGHLSLAEPHGIVSLLSNFDSNKRKILIHINNTNPILNEGSPERRELEHYGIEVSFDGMLIRM